MSNPFDLTGKRILVTGASSGIGRSVAIECSKMGAELVLMGRDKFRLEETLSMLSSNKLHIYITGDLEKGIDFDRLSSVIQEGNKLSGLVNCAGVTTTLPIKSINLERIQNTFNINVFGAFEMAKWFTKKSIVESDGGSIVFIASIMGQMGEVGKTLYSMSKGALISGCRSMAMELATKKIRVNSISPGVVLTPMVENGVYAKDHDLFNKVKQKHPLGIGESKDIANAVIFLLSDGAKWITGTNLTVDGGYTAGK